MNATVENEIRKLRVIGAVRPVPTQDLPRRSAPKTHRTGGEPIVLPHVIGVVNRPLLSTAAVRLDQAEQAA